MRRLIRQIAVVISILTLSLASPASSFASDGGTIPIVFTPLPSGTTVESNSLDTTYTSTENAPVGEWTTTINAGDDIQIVFYELSLESLGSCSAPGTSPEITSISLQTLASDPDPVDSSDATGAAIGLFTLGIDYDVVNPVYAESDNGIVSANLGILSEADGGNKTLTTALFSTAGFSSGSKLHAAVFHFADIEQGSFDLTTSLPTGSVEYSCTSGASTTPTPQTTTPQTKSPKTGASEVLIALFLVVLASSSFLIYKALHKHRNTEKLSEK